MDSRTEIDFEAAVEIRQGERVVVITKTTTVTPISGRGNEYSKRTDTTETTVLEASRARNLMSALVDAFYVASSEHDSDRPDVKDEPTVVLADKSGAEQGRFFSWNEAEEAGARLYEMTPDLAPLMVTRLNDDSKYPYATLIPTPAA